MSFLCLKEYFAQLLVVSFNEQCNRRSEEAVENRYVWKWRACPDDGSQHSIIKVQLYIIILAMSEKARKKGARSLSANIDYVCAYVNRQQHNLVYLYKWYIVIMVEPLVEFIQFLHENWPGKPLKIKKNQFSKTFFEA